MVSPEGLAVSGGSETISLADWLLLAHQEDMSAALAGLERKLLRTLTFMGQYGPSSVPSQWLGEEWVDDWEMVCIDLKVHLCGFVAAAIRSVFFYYILILRS